MTGRLRVLVAGVGLMCLSACGDGTPGPGHVPRNRTLIMDCAEINVCGGAIAMGHPLGATGAMILGTVLDELERTGQSTALATLCVGAGMGTATIIERL